MKSFKVAFVGIVVMAVLGFVFPVCADGSGDSENYDVTGQLNSVDISGHTVTLQGQPAYPVSSAVDVKLEHTGPLTFELLPQYIGRFIDLKIENNAVVEIEVEDGSDGDDTIIGANLGEDINGGNGKDTIDGGDGEDNVDGGNGDDILDGQEGDDIVKGGQGNDRITDSGFDPTHNNDKLSGGEGNDSIKAGVGNDTVDGGDGNDDLNGEDGDDAVTGGPGDDYITDTGTKPNNDDSLSGEDGNDTISGGVGNDTIDGGSGDDSINGGDGNDLINGDDPSTPTSTKTASKAAASDAKNGGRDTLDGGKGDDTINGGPGNDQIVGGLGKDKINAGDGNDQVWISAGDVPAGQTEKIDCGAGRDQVNLRNFPKKTRIGQDGKLTDPSTSGTYEFVSCERLNLTRKAPPSIKQKSVRSSENQMALLATNTRSNLMVVIFDLTGKRVLQGDLLAGKAPEYLQKSMDNIGNGVYLCMTTFRNAAGIVKNEITKLIILR